MPSSVAWINSLAPRRAFHSKSALMVGVSVSKMLDTSTKIKPASDSRSATTNSVKASRMRELDNRRRRSRAERAAASIPGAELGGIERRAVMRDLQAYPSPSYGHSDSELSPTKITKWGRQGALSAAIRDK